MASGPSQVAGMLGSMGRLTELRNRLLFVLVANARLSGRFRAEEYRERLEAAGVGREERPDFVPVGIDDEEAEHGGTNGQ